MLVRTRGAGSSTSPAASHPSRRAIGPRSVSHYEGWYKRMMMEVLAPCVQDGGDADVGTEVLAIGGNGDEGLGRSFKQQSIDLDLVLVGHRADRGRKLEYQVHIGHGQKLGFARRKPCHRSRPLAFWAVPVADDLRTPPGFAGLDSRNFRSA